MAGSRTHDRESQVRFPNEYATESLMWDLQHFLRLCDFDQCVYLSVEKNLLEV